MESCDHASAKQALLLGHETPWTLPTPSGRGSRRHVAPASVVETITAPGRELGGMNKNWGPPAEAQQSELVGQDKPKPSPAGSPSPVAVDQSWPPSFVTPTPGAPAPVGLPIPITMQSEELLHESRAGVPGPG
jgi:hypothetical protein